MKDAVCFHSIQASGMTRVSCFYGFAESFPFLLVNIMIHDAE